MLVRSLQLPRSPVAVLELEYTAHLSHPLVMRVPRELIIGYKSILNVAISTLQRTASVLSSVENIS